MSQNETDLDFTETKTLAKATSRTRWNVKHPNYNELDPYHCLRRAQSRLLKAVQRNRNVTGI